MVSPIVAHGRGPCSAKREPIKKFGVCYPRSSNLAGRENDLVALTARLSTLSQFNWLQMRVRSYLAHLAVVVHRDCSSYGTF
jgi:hypothetical protein